MAVVSVRARPGAKRSEVVGQLDGAWTIRVAAPPVEGKANAELIRYLAEVLGVPKSSVAIRHGGRARVKLVDIHGLAQAEVDDRLSRARRG